MSMSLRLREGGKRWTWFRACRQMERPVRVEDWREMERMMQGGKEAWALHQTCRREVNVLEEEEREEQRLAWSPESQEDVWLKARTHLRASARGCTRALWRPQRLRTSTYLPTREIKVSYRTEDAFDLIKLATHLTNLPIDDPSPSFPPVSTIQSKNFFDSSSPLTRMHLQISPPSSSRICRLVEHRLTMSGVGYVGTRHSCRSRYGGSTRKKAIEWRISAGRSESEGDVTGRGVGRVV
jgi:hypothetical protein